jgi:hypothetical protein
MSLRFALSAIGIAVCLVFTAADVGAQKAPPRRPDRPGTRANPNAGNINARPAAPTAAVSILSIADFNDERAKEFPREENLARGGRAAASSTHENMDEPFTALGGGRKYETWALKGGSGWFEASWPEPLTARNVLVFNRPGTGDNDHWDVGTVEINGELAATFDRFSRGQVLVLDLPRPVEIRTIKVWLQGDQNPGLCGLEIYRGALK